MKLKSQFTAGVAFYQTPLEVRVGPYLLSGLFKQATLKQDEKWVTEVYTQTKYGVGSEEYPIFAALPTYKMVIGLSVFGVPFTHWDKVNGLYKSQQKPLKFNRGDDMWWEIGKRALLIAKESFLPPLIPYYAYGLGYTQEAYRAHIAVVWDDVHPLYDEPWEVLLEWGKGLKAVGTMDTIASFTKEMVDATVQESVRLVWEFAQSQSRK